MKFDVTKLKKIESNDEQSTLIHPDGHSIILEHKKLRPEVLKILMSLPMHNYAAGGEVSEPKRDPAKIEFTQKAKKGLSNISEKTLKEQAESLTVPHRFDPIFEKGSQIAGIDPWLFKSFAAGEGGLLPKSEAHVTPKSKTESVYGVMQLSKNAIKDAENEGYKIKDVFNPEQNILGSAYYLRALKKQLMQKDPKRYEGGVPERDLIGAFHMGAQGWLDAMYGGKNLPKTTQEEFTKYTPLVVDAVTYGRANKIFARPFLETKFVPPQTLKEQPIPAAEIDRNVQSTDKRNNQQKPSEQYGPGVYSQVPYSPEYSQKLTSETKIPYTPQYSQELQQQANALPNQKVPWSSNYGPGATTKGVQTPIMTPGKTETYSAIEQPIVSPAVPEFQQTLQPVTTKQAPQMEAPKSFEEEMAKGHGAPQITSAEGAQAEVSPGVSERPDFMGYKWLEGQLGEAYKAQQAAAQTQMNAYTDAARNINKQLKDQQKEYKALWDRRNQYLNQYENEVKKSIGMLENQQIDPNRWIHANVSTVPQKIMTAIGLLISGVGAGLTGQENMASKWINDQITRDIDAQKTNFDRGNNILNAYTNYFKNLKDGLDMTEAVMKNYYANLIQQEVNKQEAKVKSADALALIAKLQAEAAIKMQELAQRSAMGDFFLKTMQQGAGGAPGAGPNPSAQIRAYEMMGVVDKSQAEKMYKDVQTHNMNIQKLQELRQAYDELMRLNTIASYSEAPVQTWNRIDALKAQILGPLSRALTGQFSEFESKTLEHILPKFTDNQETLRINSEKFNKIMENAFNIMNRRGNYPELEAYGITLPQVQPVPIKREMPQTYKPQYLPYQR